MVVTHVSGGGEEPPGLAPAGSGTVVVLVKGVRRVTGRRGRSWWWQFGAPWTAGWVSSWRLTRGKGEERE